MSSKPDPYNSLKNKLIFGKYKTSKIIGKGSFGCVYKGVNIKTRKDVAIKFEAKNADSHLLKIEFSFLSFLKGFGIPKLISYGKYFNYNVMVQEILGFNLMQIKNIITKFTIKDIAMMGIQMMDRIEFIHSRYILHRDIKPENFTIGYDDITNIYLIDFGISRKYRSSRTLKHVKYALIGRMFGTVRYASYNASRGVEQSRRDDLESIGNMLIYIYTGKLPWKGISLKDKQRKKKYLEMLLLKKYTPIETICNNMPKEFIDYYKYCRKLNFEQDPDYEYLRNVFRSILSSLHELYDYKFSWLFNKSYLQKLKEYNQYNPKTKPKPIINVGGKININYKQPNPSNKLYKKIKYSLEKNESERYKRSVGRSEYLAPQDNNININNIIDLESIKTYNRGRSEDAVKLKERNDINENQNNLDKSKTDLTYKSVFAQYNMNVDEFQDETKIYEQNKSIINKIKNSKNDNLNEMNINFSELQSYNVHSENKSIKNIFNISLILKDFKRNNNTKCKLNLSLDLGINYIKGNTDNINNAELIRAKSQETKNNLIKKNSLTNQEKQIQNKQKELYKIIMDKIMKKKPPKINEVKNEPNKNIYISKHAKTKTGINNKNDLYSDNFSFGNFNPGKINTNNISRGSNGQNKGRILNINNRKNKPPNNIKRIYPPKIKNNNNIYVNKNNNKTKNIIENNINADKGIKIIINTNINSLKPAQKIPIKNFYIGQNSATMPPSENIKMNPIKNRHTNSINIINNSQVKQFINNNFMKKNNNNQNNNNIILIPNKSNQFINMNNRIIPLNNMRNNNNIYNTNYKFYSNTNNTNSSITNNITNLSSLNSSQKMSNNYIKTSQNSIKTFDYIPISKRNSNSPKINHNNNYQILKKKLLFNRNIKEINLDNLKPKIMTKNYSYDAINNKIKITNVNNHNSLSNLNTLFKNNQRIVKVVPQNKAFNINNINQLRIRYYSPNNNINHNNKYKNLFSQHDKQFIIKRKNIRNNSETNIKKVLNFNNSNINITEKLIVPSRSPKNINNLNSLKFNYFGSKCYNFIKI